MPGYREAPRRSARPGSAQTGGVPRPCSYARTSRVYRNLDPAGDRDPSSMGSKRGAPMIERAWLEPAAVGGAHRALPAARTATSGRRFARGKHDEGGALPRTAGRHCAAIASTSKCSETGRTGGNRDTPRRSWTSPRRAGSPRSRPTTVRLPDQRRVRGSRSPACASTTAPCSPTRPGPGAMPRPNTSRSPLGDGGSVSPTCRNSSSTPSRWPGVAPWRSSWALSMLPRLSRARRQHHRGLLRGGIRSAGMRRRLGEASAPQEPARRRSRLCRSTGPGTRRHLQPWLCGYFLIVADFIRLGARKTEVPVGTRPRLGGRLRSWRILRSRSRTSDPIEHDLAVSSDS